MEYFSYISYTLAFRNNLEKAVHAYLRERERKVIRSIDVEIYKAEILTRIAELNIEHNRCKPLKCDWWDMGQHSEYADLRLTGFGNVYFFLYASK